MVARLHWLGRRSWLALLLAVTGAIALILAGGAPTSTSTPFQTGTAAALFETFFHDGAWARTEDGLLRTTDAGRSWRDVTPKGLRGGALETAYTPAVFFRDGSHASIASFSTPPPSSQTIQEPRPVTATIYRTTDGGATWGSEALQLDVDATRFGNQGGLFFLDENNGWLMATLMSGSAFSLGVLYRTQDGGQTWNEVSIPIAGPFYFTSPSDGWVAGGPAGTQLHVTQDGGVTWTEQIVPLKSSDEPWKTQVALPTFFDELNGVLPIEVTVDRMTNSATLYVYRSQDGGESWAPGGASLRLTNRGVVQAGRALRLSFVDSDTWLRHAEGQLSLTRNAGRSWSAISTGEFLQSANRIVFTSAKNGWAHAFDSSCPKGRGPCVSESHLFRTEDGGQTWREEPLEAKVAR